MRTAKQHLGVVNPARDRDSYICNSLRTRAAPMGILDDAIREHLDLKRRLGAREAEVKRLEDEAFGPPARPGEPEFGGAGDGESGAADTSDAADGSALAAPPAPDDAPASTSESASTRGPESSDGDEPTTPVEPAVEGAEGGSPAEQARLAHPELEDTDSHAPFDAGAKTSSGAPAAEPDTDSEDFDVGDLSLAFDDEPGTLEEEEALGDEGPKDETAEERRAPAEDEVAEERGAPPEEEAALEGGAAAEDEVALEEEATAEHETPAATAESPDPGGDGFGELSVEDGEPEGDATPLTDPVEPEPDDLADLSLEPEEPEDEPPQVAEPKEGPGEAGEERDDLLEETPEFLRDAPESDELWFEQDKPQDFDFDDEES